MLFRKILTWSAASTLLGCLLGVAIAALAIARDDNGGSQMRSPLNAQTQQLQQTIDRQRLNDEMQHRRAGDLQSAAQPGATQPGANQPGEERTIELAGQGRQASAKFNLAPGVCLLEVDNDGEGNFIVRLLDENGQEIDTPVNQIGPFKGQTSFAIDGARQYLLNVESSGNWTAKLSQPRPQAGQSLPTTLEGAGYQATPFIQLDTGLVVFKLNHNGQGRFKVRLADRNGNTIDHLVNELGEFAGSKPVSIEQPGLYYLNVSADGDWSIDVQ